MRVKIPQINIWERVQGIEKILEIFQFPFQKQKMITFCFDNCRFISSEAIAILAGIKSLRDNLGLVTNVDMDTINYRVRNFLNNSRFLKMFDLKNFRSSRTSLPINVQRKFQKDEILQYIDKEIMERSEMPEMSEDLKKEIRKAFFEIFGNVFSHSESKIGGLVCGQVYPNEKEIQIVFYDTGIGIAKRVKNIYPELQDKDAIKWALMRGTSTSSNFKESRGLGLYLIWQFLKVNGGEIRIYANTGYFEEIKGNKEFGSLAHALNGTLIDLRIKVRDDVKYGFNYEFD